MLVLVRIGVFGFACLFGWVVEGSTWSNLGEPPPPRFGGGGVWLVLVFGLLVFGLMW